jgi:hypothetical protein
VPSQLRLAEQGLSIDRFLTLVFGKACLKLSPQVDEGLLLEVITARYITHLTRGSSSMFKLLTFPLIRWARKLRPATLFKIAAALVCIDVVLPELIPFELLFGIGTLVLSHLSGRFAEASATSNR